MFDFITGIIGSVGALGVALLMLAENVFPPIPSELIMPLAGFKAATGDLSLWAVLVAGTLGSVLGAVIWYELGRALGVARFLALVDRFGIWATISRDDAEHALDWFRRKGAMAVFFGRLVPAVRTLISVPAGLAGMRRLPFILMSTLGSAVWVTLLTGAGYLLEAEYERVSAFLDPATTAVLVGIVAVYVFRVTRQLARRRPGR